MNVAMMMLALTVGGHKCKSCCEPPPCCETPCVETCGACYSACSGCYSTSACSGYHGACSGYHSACSGCYSGYGCSACTGYGSYLCSGACSSSVCYGAGSGCYTPSAGSVIYETPVEHETVVPTKKAAKPVEKAEGSSLYRGRSGKSALKSVAHRSYVSRPTVVFYAR